MNKSLTDAPAPLRAFLDRRALAIFLSVFSFLVLIAHQAVPPLDRDESRFAQASRQMLNNGDFITPRFQDDLRAKKPIGIYWMQAASATLFGQDAIASYRLPSLIGFVLTIFMVWRAAPGFGLAAPPARLLAAGLLGTGFLIFAEAVQAKTDAMLLASCCAMQLCLWEIYRHRNSGTAHPQAWLGFWVFMALAVLIKGPIPFALAFPCIGLLCLSERRLDWVFALKPGRGLALLVLIAVPWYVAVSVATDGVFLQRAFFEDFASKIQSGQESHGAPPGTYAATQFAFLFPVSVFLIPVLIHARTLFRQDVGRFLVCWIIGFWIIFEATPTKLPHYVLPTYPALMMLMAIAYTRGFPKNWHKHLTHFGLALVILVGAAMLYYVHDGIGQLGGATTAEAMTGWWLAVLLVPCIFASYALMGWRFDSLHVLAFLVITITFQAAIYIGVVSNLERMHLNMRVATAIGAMPATDKTVIMLGHSEPSLVFQSAGRDGLGLQFAPTDQAVAKFANGLTDMVFVEARKRAGFEQALATRGLAYNIGGTVEGYNYSRGRDVTFTIYLNSDMPVRP